MLTTAVISAVLLLSPLSSPVQASSPGCDADLAATGLCSTNTGTVLDISAIRHQPGSEDGSPPEVDLNSPVTPLPPCVTYLNDRCVDYLFQRPDEAVPGTPAITITDLASFAPDPTTLTAEPDNVGI
ncbi:hypothetical protein IPV10_01410, partial [Microbacterium sp. SD291]|nr:hypothetical protein [Microbacterium sp. SD291]